MKREIHIFFTALMFYTRIPFPKFITYSPQHHNENARYLAVVGIIVGGIGGITYYLSSFIFASTPSE